MIYINEYFEMKLAINFWKCMIILSTNRELLLLLKQYRNFIETTIYWLNWALFEKNF